MKYLLMLSVLTCFSGSNGNSGRSMDVNILEPKIMRTMLISHYNAMFKNIFLEANLSEENLTENVRVFKNGVDEFFSSELNQLLQADVSLRLFASFKTLDSVDARRFAEIATTSSWQSNPEDLATIGRIADMSGSDLEYTIGIYNSTFEAEWKTAFWTLMDAEEQIVFLQEFFNVLKQSSSDVEVTEFKNKALTIILEALNLKLTDDVTSRSQPINKNLSNERSLANIRELFKMENLLSPEVNSRLNALEGKISSFKVEVETFKAGL